MIVSSYYFEFTGSPRSWMRAPPCSTFAHSSVFGEPQGTSVREMPFQQPLFTGEGVGGGFLHGRPWVSMIQFGNSDHGLSPVPPPLLSGPQTPGQCRAAGAQKPAAKFLLKAGAVGLSCCALHSGQGQMGMWKRQGESTPFPEDF